MDSEEWVTIKGYDYFISTYGAVENGITGKILKPQSDKDGYHCVNLYKNGKQKKFKIHRLVAEAFINNPENKKCVDHINNNKLDNNINNLRWATNSENGMNRSIQSNNTSGFKGVHYDKASDKWMAYIKIDGKHKTIGLFKTKEEASFARQEYATEYFGEYINQCEK